MSCLAIEHFSKARKWQKTIVSPMVEKGWKMKCSFVPTNFRRALTHTLQQQPLVRSWFASLFQFLCPFLKNATLIAPRQQKWMTNVPFRIAIGQRCLLLAYVHCGIDAATSIATAQLSRSQYTQQTDYHFSIFSTPKMMRSSAHFHFFLALFGIKRAILKHHFEVYTILHTDSLFGTKENLLRNNVRCLLVYIWQLEKKNESLQTILFNSVMKCLLSCFSIFKSQFSAGALKKYLHTTSDSHSNTFFVQYFTNVMIFSIETKKNVCLANHTTMQIIFMV